MNKVHFVDTSVLDNLLNVPGKNQDHYTINEEYKQLAENGDTFVLPVAVLVETGNHIAQARGGDRFALASTFASLVSDAVNGEGNWHVRPAISDSVLKSILSQYPEKASGSTGFGDVSIIEQFEEYWHDKQPIGEMRIWSTDRHLSAYPVRQGGLQRRKHK